ncbi:LysR substrate-binding domain-containing protein [Reinekea marinisedimentorum]|uniref:DNA-binding transcriptional LysR family regulator n=1 Tax=Reinekea marinisedimentorum TaxID=230495 RepID=A0A4R3I045_9GAMM|nr:LysR substrate-binding domain-containing protein [Reinekea marinisedimentorum]TCS38888.1 DNA-binding transcriptional LysR family regulator [Reinekea marinisedimentorum]
MMKYSLKQLSVFDAVASLESVSGAARKLSLTQSAVSMSLSQLESLLGRPLFIRQGNRLVLSHWGEWLRPRARRLLQDAQQIELGLHDHHIISGRFQIGSSQTAGQHLLPDLITKIDTDFPQLRIDLNVRNTNSIIEGVINYEYQLGIIEGRCDDSRVHQERWIDDYLVIVAAPTHPFARHADVSLAQLEQAKWVLRESGAGTRRIFNSAIHGLIDHIDVWKEFEQVAILKAMAIKGPYLTCLPYLDVECDVEKGKLVILHTPQLNMERSLSFIWRNDEVENPLRDCVLSEAHRMAKRREREKNQVANKIPAVKK